ncbi:cell cycle checkpoint control protein RAD9A-like [Stegodyphus dumicola]|uniref:cell cycle checkpoint control protein RAD9A-like n=1 Tax=Stegodyphus dumicola TaxID=202533 RepID=UPI0015AF87B3|nr:cell cycle checkpoint control protein RAD9A-like [Stegodyphus dumicola]
MSCLINATNVKIFGKAFHALSRIADDLYIEALPSGLVFHTVNASKSAYACFTFKPEFFITYRDDLMEKRKVLIKACLMAFRSLPNLEKNVEKCLFDLNSMTDFLLLKFFCKHGMVKVYQLHFIENETVQGSFPKTGFLCKLTASSRLLHDGIQNFSNSVEELTLTVSSNKVYLRNYVDDEPDPNKVVHTELTLESEEFESFEVEKEMKITFCLKELKAILNFCEGFNVPITIKCQAGGKPVTFSISALKGVDVHFVLATLADRDTQSVSSSMSLLRTSVAQCSKDRDKQLELDNKEENGISANHSSDTKSSGNINASVQRLPKFAKQITFSDDDDDDDTDDDIVINPEPVPADHSDQDEVPSTPPHKKFRSLFLGLSQATCASMAADPDEVLVPDSDDEK